MKPIVLVLCLFIVCCASVPSQEAQQHEEKPVRTWMWVGLGILSVGVLAAALSSDAEPSDGSYRCRENFLEEVICEPL